MYRVGQTEGTRELVVCRKYVVYAEGLDAVSILRVLHATQKWPDHGGED